MQAFQALWTGHGRPLWSNSDAEDQRTPPRAIPRRPPPDLVSLNRAWLCVPASLIHPVCRIWLQSRPSRNIQAAKEVSECVFCEIPCAPGSLAALPACRPRACAEAVGRSVPLPVPESGIAGHRARGPRAAPSRAQRGHALGRGAPRRGPPIEPEMHARGPPPYAWHRAVLGGRPDRAPWEISAPNPKGGRRRRSGRIRRANVCGSGLTGESENVYGWGAQLVLQHMGLLAQTQSNKLPVATVSGYRADPPLAAQRRGWQSSTPRNMLCRLHPCSSKWAPWADMASPWLLQTVSKWDWLRSGPTLDVAFPKITP